MCIYPTYPALGEKLLAALFVFIALFQGAISF